MQTGPVMLHFGYNFPKVLHFSRNRVLFLYVLRVIFFGMKIRHIIYASLFTLVVSFSASAQQLITGNAVVSAVKEYDNGNYAKATSLLEKVLTSDPSNDAAWYYLGLCSLAEKDVELAEFRLGKAAELDPGNFWYRYRLAGIYASTSRIDQTVEIYESLLADFPKKTDLYFDLAQMYSAQGQKEKALQTLKDIETVLGITESVAVYRFGLLMDLNRQEEAYRSLEEYNSRYSSPYVLATLAEHQLSMYNDSTAISLYNEALDIAPDYVPALLGKAEALRMTRRYEEYFEALEDFAQTQTDMPRSKTDYISAVIKRSDPKFINAFIPKFDSVMDRMSEVHPSDSNVLNLSGLYYHSTNRRDKALQSFRKNRECNPASLSAAAGYVEYLMLDAKWSELSDQGRAAYESFPEEPAFLEMASMGDYNLKEYDKVIELCDMILEVAPADSAKVLRAWSTKGDIYHQLQEPKKAYKAYENALKINPEYTYVLNNYAYYLSMEGKNMKKAYAMSRKTIEAEPDNATYLDTFGWILYLMGRPEEAKPHFKHAMLYGGKESVVILDHYAEVLFALGEYDRAIVYWNLALHSNKGEIADLEEKVNQRRLQMKKKDK